MDKVRMIETSFRVLKYGYLSLIPLFGLFAAFAAFYHFSRVFYFTREDWNPARGDLYWGAALALASCLLHGLAFTIPIIRVLE
jgi:hypothetical protein